VPAVAAFNHDLEGNLLALQDALLSDAWTPGPFTSFFVTDPKRRTISAAPYADRVVHHAVCRVVAPLFERTFIFDSYACRTGKGSHAAVDRLTTFMRRGDYVLQLDIRQFYPSVDHEVLKTLLRRRVTCPRTLYLLDLIVEHGAGSAGVSPAHRDEAGETPALPAGLPIGNLTSQWYANIYLDALDHYVKETLSHRLYLRYMDDMILAGDDKAMLWAARDAIVAFLTTRLHLTLHLTKQWIHPASAGVDFLGYRVFPDHRRLLRASGYRFQRRLRAFQRAYAAGDMPLDAVSQRVSAWLGHAQHADTYGLRSALLGGAVFSRARAPEAACCAAAPGTVMQTTAG
jgi:RNA-directed DNA polymerase